jgi:exodeoxyribonuclease V alpha subunit
LSDLLIFLQTYAVSNSLCLRLYKAYRDKVKNVLEKNPYRIANEIQGIGFKTTDKIAINLDIPTNHHSRIEAGICFCLNTFKTMGNRCVSREMFAKNDKLLWNFQKLKSMTSLIFLSKSPV